MWDLICIILIAIEIILLDIFVITRLKKKKLHQTIQFLVAVFICNLLLYFIPYLYSLIELKEESNYVLDVLAMIMDSLKLFLGDINIDFAKEFSEVTPIYTYSYLLGAVLALIGTISTALQAFNARIVNSFKVSKCLKQEYCDIVFGNDELSLKYAKKNKNTILFLDEKTTTKDDSTSLMNKGYLVIRKVFNLEFLKSNSFNNQTKYNLIFPMQDDKFFKVIETYISYSRDNEYKSNIELYLEISEEKVSTVKREIIEKYELQNKINVFSRNELMVRDFIERHPVTEFLSKDFFSEDTSIKSDKKINVFFLGFSKLNEELYRQYIINNQLVYFDKQYKVFPLNYQIFEEKLDRSSILSINELKNDLLELQNNKKEYYSLPELPYSTTYHFKKSPLIKDNLLNILNNVKEDNSYTYIIIDVNDDYQNIDLGLKVNLMLSAYSNYHIFVRSNNKYTVDKNNISYYGNFEQFFNHEVIVKENLSKMAKTLNKLYVKQQLRDCNEELINNIAEENWNKFNDFTIFSNISSALSLRLKLNLLGLDYISDGKGENINIIEERYIRNEEYNYQDYKRQSIKNALLAQEHARWNAYHLLNEFLPLRKEDISIKNQTEENISFNLKNLDNKKHACLTTFNGLDLLSKDLSKRSSKVLNRNISIEEYDLYKYDESLMLSICDLMKELNYSIIEKI